ncbi:hypothetical protein L596_005835 [Steinernema carpocapsae]|uniref:Uncharacterized protein n=1 Tax=Steinernema carpocapsae TaxID=34508 RepID=A0A4U8V4V7_STECR|nr:hypothetical protein L596_005835 [Steinernema carpocapsae]
MAHAKRLNDTNKKLIKQFFCCSSFIYAQQAVITNVSAIISNQQRATPHTSTLSCSYPMCLFPTGDY